VDDGRAVILLTFRDLTHRAVRFVVVIVLVAVVFALLFVMTGLVEQFHREPEDAVDAFGATDWILPAGISGPFTATPTMPTATVDEVDAAERAPVVAARSSLIARDEGEEIVLVGTVSDGLGTPDTTSGRPATAPGEVVVDESLGLDVGATVTLAGAPFTVVGETSDTTILAGLPLVFVPLTDAQELVFRSDDVISGVLAVDVASIPPGTEALTAQDVAADTLGPLDGAIASVDLVRVLLWIVAAIIIGAVVYLSALERERDFAVLKAVGASTRSLLGSLALQAVLVALVAVLLAVVVQRFLAPAFPLRVRVPARAFWQLPALAVVMALIAGAIGMRRVARSDPAMAFDGGR
jgi:putative ABC transport system permease protein